MEINFVNSYLLNLVILLISLNSVINCIDQSVFTTPTTVSRETTTSSETNELSEQQTNSNSSSRIEYQVFLVQQDNSSGSIDDDINKLENKHNNKLIINAGSSLTPPSTNSKANSTSTTTTQIYIIIFLGFVPAVFGVFVFWIRNCTRGCTKGKSDNHTERDLHSHENFNNDKLFQTSTTNPLSINESEIGQITYKIIQRAEKLNGSHALWYDNSSDKSSFVKSRRVYSMEMPRKNLEMLELLGEGNFGQVWKAKAIHLTRTNGWSIVAVKTNKTNTSEKDSEDLLKELDIMLQLGTHQNVVKLLGCCTVNEPYFLIMEYVSNGKLLTYLRNHRADRTYYNTSTTHSNSNSNNNIINNNIINNYNNINNNYTKNDHDEVKKTLSAKDLIVFAYQISKGMEFINSHGIVHRDLAARNVLITNDKVCKICDFGLSRSIRDRDIDFYEQKTNGEMPIRWMSPESLFLSQFSTKSDVWSYGVLLWEIITLGSTPYIGFSAQEVIKFVKEGGIMEQPKHCSDQLYAIMKSCWSLDPMERLSFTELRQKLTKMIEFQCGYIDLDHFPNSIYYNLYNSPGEKV